MRSDTRLSFVCEFSLFISLVFTFYSQFLFQQKMWRKSLESVSLSLTTFGSFVLLKKSLKMSHMSCVRISRHTTQTAHSVGMQWFILLFVLPWNFLSFFLCSHSRNHHRKARYLSFPSTAHDWGIKGPLYRVTLLTSFSYSMRVLHWKN